MSTKKLQILTPIVTSINGETGDVTIDMNKTAVGLDKVDNTSDADKPISTATQTALDSKQDKITAKGLLRGDGTGNIAAVDGSFLAYEPIADVEATTPIDADTLNGKTYDYINSTKQDKLTAGNNISIDNNVVSTKAFPCNPNLLVNWYFPNPVNQRGQAEYEGTGIYNVPCIDRWKVQFEGTKYTVATSTLESTSETNVGQMNYMMPNNEAMPFVGRQMTFSMLVDNPDGINASIYVRDRTRWSHLLPAKTGSGSLITTTGVFGALNSGEDIQLSVTIPHGTSIVPIAAKLELGGVQTLAHQDTSGNWVLNEIPSYAEQVSLCQRYLIPLSSYQCPASKLETNAILFFVPLPVTMRVLPVIKQNGFQVLSKSGEAQTGFTFSVSSLRSNGVIISAAKTGHGMTDAVLNAGTNGSLLSAEL